MSPARFVVSAVALLALGLQIPTHAQKPPQETVETLRAADGIEVSLFASEPMITNPAAIDIDTHGRVWVAEIQFYRKRQGPDKIKVLEDTDGDGRADKATVFADNVYQPMSVCVAGDKVYVATSPDLWVYEDKNGDLKADGPPKKLLTGFGGKNHDHGAHSLVLGPDHKWYMAHGDRGFNVEGTDGSKIGYKWGAMLRGELDGSELEMTAHNFRNPYEICVSSFGETYCSDNDNDGNQSVRICWILEGGNYGWYGRPPFNKKQLDALVPPGTPYREHWHFRGHIPGNVPATICTGFGSPTGICFYESDAFGEAFKNVPVHCDAGPRIVRRYPHENEGYGMTAESIAVLTTQGDNYFRPSDVCVAPDGSMLVADWYDGGVGGHNYNNPDQGRIYLLRPAGKELERNDKAGPYSSIDDAIAGLKSPNLATQYLAREKLLADGEKSIPALRSLLDSDEPNFVARALWVLDRIGGEGRNIVRDYLKSDDDTFRALACRILRRHGGEDAEAVAALHHDSSPEVRREVLLAIRDMEGLAAEAMLYELAEMFDGRDRYELEAINVAAASEERRKNLFDRLIAGGNFDPSQLALLQVLNPEGTSEFLLAKLSDAGVDNQVRQTLLATVGSNSSPAAAKGMLELLADKEQQTEIRGLALARISANLGGSWQHLAEEEQLFTVLRDALADEALSEPALAAIEKHGLTELAGDVLKIASKAKGSNKQRLRAIETAVVLRSDETKSALRDLLTAKDESVRTAALDGLLTLQDSQTLERVLTADQFADSVKQHAVDQMMSTTGGALAVLRLVDERKLASDTKQHVLTAAADHPDANVRALYDKHLPAALRPKRLGEAIKAEEILAINGDANRGESIFFRSSAAQCKNCHTVEGKGGDTGPDLSMIGKKYERAALLETILAPSKAIAPEYYAYLVQTDSGQVYAGFLLEKTDDQVVLKDIKGQVIRLDSDEILRMAKQEKSLMPELVLRDVTAQDAADLLAFLSSLRASTLPVSRFRVAGPFPINKGDLDGKLPPEENLASPDISQEFSSELGRTGWEVVASDGSLGFPGIDTVKYDKLQKKPSDNVAHYFLVYADSLADQQAELLIGSDDGVKVWLNGEEVHRNATTRAVAFGQDKAKVELSKGRNVIVMKVINGDGAGGAALGIAAEHPIELRTE